jgi:hypothetical protein
MDRIPVETAAIGIPDRLTIDDDGSALRIRWRWPRIAAVPTRSVSRLGCLFDLGVRGRAEAAHHPALATQQVLCIEWARRNGPMTYEVIVRLTSERETRPLGGFATEREARFIE